ncbi:MAG: FtsX-like permease family protein [Lentisphaerae bacterium]|nr:FtsX-like permease family protein [Lentisphaerota bacterium]
MPNIFSLLRRLQNSCPERSGWNPTLHNEEKQAVVDLWRADFHVRRGVLQAAVLTGKALWCRAVLVLAAGCLCSTVGATEQFMADCKALTKAEHRLMGSPESVDAAKYLEQRLRSLGLEQVIIQNFPAGRLVVKQCEIILETPEGPRRMPLQPMRPNGIIPPVTLEQGLRGELLDAGRGELSDYGNRSALDKIVILDYNSDDGWLRAFRMGAAAVIFVSNAPAQSWHLHYLEAPANFPRFYYAGDRRDLPEGGSVLLHSAVAWEAADGHNVIAFLPGTDPVFALGMKEAVVLAAPLDSFGEAPGLSPGARGAANCAAALAIAETLVKQPPRRDIVLAFFDGQAFGHAGVSAFYRALEKPTEVETEVRFLQLLEECLQADELNSSNPAATDEIIRRLKTKAAEHVNAIGLAIEDLRKAREALAPRRGLAVRAPSVQPAWREQLQQYQEQKNNWNNLRRALGRRDLGLARRPPLAGLMATALAEARADVSSRQQELARRSAASRAEAWLNERLGKSWIGLHAALLLGDDRNRWGLVIGGDSAWHAYGDQSGLYGRLQNVFLAAAGKLAGNGAPLSHFECSTVDRTIEPRLFWTAPLAHSGEIAGRLGIYNVAFATGQDPLIREGTPEDTFERLQPEAIETQAREIGTLLAEAASGEGLTIRRSIVPNAGYFLPGMDANGKIQGPVVMDTLQNNVMAGAPAPHSVIQLRPWGGALFQFVRIPGFNNYQIAMADANGSYGFGPVLYDPGQTVLQGFAAKFNSRGNALAVSTLESAAWVQTRLNLISCAPEVFDNERRVLSPRYGAAVLAPFSESRQPVKVMRALGSAPLNAARSFSATQEGIVFWYADKWVEAINLFGLEKLVSLAGPARSRYAPARNATHSVAGGSALRAGGADEHARARSKTADAAQGQGLSLLSPWRFPASALRSAADLWRLNETRLANLRARGVMNSSLEELHGRAEDLCLASGKALTTMRREALALSAFFMEGAVYLDLRNMLNDLVKAVLILLALALPFAYALERLLIGAVNIYRQIAWFGLFFIATFLFLYAVHPAFALSAQPIIIFLAFALVVLSGLVILLMMRKFEQELKILQGFTATVHAADVSRFSTTLAAVNMAISTMRRRPLRTGLTALTVILLTFTILNFASFSRKLGVVKLFKGSPAPYSGIFLHEVNHAALNPGILDIIMGRWSFQATVTTRIWQNAALLERLDGAKAVSLRGVLGLDAREIAARPDFQVLFGAPTNLRANWVFLTETLARFIGVTPGDTVMVGGIRLDVAGLLSSAMLTSATDMDGNSILPVDFTAMGAGAYAARDAQQAPGESLLAACENETEWANLPADSVVIVSTASARRMNGILRAVTLYTQEPNSTSAIAEDLARVFPLPVVATLPQGVYLHVLAPMIGAQGVKDLFFPLLLGGLVVFGTLLGSVADREREIYTFSALGLAPPHVATLFVAEAMVYSCIGGVGGYLLAQGLLKVLLVLESFGVGTAPEMNYSSLNAIMAIVIVMGIVLLSAIYPAFKASRSANPGILRAWRLPAPDGDRFQIVFPFTVSQYDIPGVISFLREHFENFSDTSLGVFMARDIVVAGAGAGRELLASVALAPFDLGVTQSFRMRSAPSEVPGIDEVTIELERKSGQKSDWRRLNRNLLNDLRRQFLIWRSLSHDTMELYRNRTMMMAGTASGPAEGQNGELARHSLGAGGARSS